MTSCLLGYWCTLGAADTFVHHAAEAGGHMLALVSPTILYGTYGQIAFLLVCNLWRCVA